MYKNYKIIMLASLALLMGQAQAKPPKIQKSPEKMVHYLVRIIKIDSKSKKIDMVEHERWRAGNTKMRTKESSPLGNLMEIIDEPDIYKMNTDNLNMVHEIDKEVPALIKAPLISENPGLDDLEFGKEFAFFKDNQAEKGSDAIGFIGYDTYKIKKEKFTLSLYTKENEKDPVYVTYMDDANKIVFAYQKYETVDFDPKMFQIPKKTIAIED